MPFLKFLLRPSGLTLLGPAFLLFRLGFAQLDVDPGGTAIIERWLAAEYSRYQLARRDIGL
jgi:hypothetical protein